jgi:hypothetical protein
MSSRHEVVRIGIADIDNNDGATDLTRISIYVLIHSPTDTRGFANAKVEP